ncbi:hypothetical protein [Sphingosinicella sp.]
MLVGLTSTLGIFGLLIALLFVKSRPANHAMLATLVGLVLLSAYGRSAL